MVSAASAEVIEVNEASAASAPRVRLKLRREVVMLGKLLKKSPAPRGR
jgi:hypothetical protein